MEHGKHWSGGGGRRSIRTSCVSGRSGWCWRSASETGERHGAVTRVAKELGIGTESLRQWVNRAEIDSGRRPGTSTADAQRIAQLEREERELRRANDILKAASVFFATELDGRPKR